MHQEARALPLKSVLPVCVECGWRVGGLAAVCVGTFPLFYATIQKTKDFLETGRGGWHLLGPLSASGIFILNGTYSHKIPAQALHILCHCIVTVGCGDEL